MNSKCCAVLRCSASIAAGRVEDRSGKRVADMLRDAGAQIAETRANDGSAQAVSRQVLDWVEAGVPFIFTVGGTGLGEHDHATAAVRALLQKQAPGIVHAMYAHGLARTAHAMLSDCVAGTVGRSLVVTLPGSSSGAAQALEAILPGVFHVYKMLYPPA